MNYDVPQLTDSELEKILEANDLIIEFNRKKNRWELFRCFGNRKMFLTSCEFKTLLWVQVKHIDLRRVQSAIAQRQNDMP